ncbi:S1/P1 nuclease [Thermaurantiacus tibetensis]|uniref:S1/P1 nuclease n=1 Tax=Thermaurantiacus tibetensis TaxID=2759035 RepID=UPI00188EED81|nr:S1/P1 nuclease [Thermaurantiacus tibetensis]
MRRLAAVVRLVALAILGASAVPAAAWGPTGHRITGALAEHYLSPRARAGVMEILGTESLEEASTWPDHMRSAPGLFWRVTASPWHYVTVPDGRRWRDQPAPAEGDAVTALDRFARTIRDPAASPSDKALALRFAIHIVGDLAQPLHVGRPGDRGGNDVKVRFFGRETNLHAVWDSDLIDHERLSFSEWAARLHRRLTPEQLRAWSSPDPEQWVDDAVAIRAGLYPDRPDLAWDYVFAQRETLDAQLAKGGLRLAAWLNRLFDAP